MLTGGAFRPDYEKEEPHRFAVDRIVGDRRRRDAADETELRHPARTSVGNGHPEADSGGASRLTFPHGSQDLSVIATQAIRQMTCELGDDTGLVAGQNRNNDLLGREELGQEHGCSRDGMDSNLYRATEWGNPLVELTLAYFPEDFNEVHAPARTRNARPPDGPIIIRGVDAYPALTGRVTPRSR